jgi:hypothetical protein
MPPPEASLGQKICGRSRGCGVLAPTTLLGCGRLVPAGPAPSPQHPASSFALPFAMVGSICSTALRGGTCTDSSCSMRHDLIRCEPCNRSILSTSLQEHRSGKQHLRNVASSGARPSPPSQTASTSLSTPPANTSPPVGGIPIHDTDPRVNVSGEGGLDFTVEGSGTSATPLFSSTNHKISIEKTNVSSNLSLQSITLRPSLGSWCELFGQAIHNSHKLSIVSLRLWLAS